MHLVGRQVSGEKRSVSAAICGPRRRLAAQRMKAGHLTYRLIRKPLIASVPMNPGAAKDMGLLNQYVTANCRQNVASNVAVPDSLTSVRFRLAMSTDRRNTHGAIFD